MLQLRATEHCEPTQRISTVLEIGTEASPRGRSSSCTARAQQSTGRSSTVEQDEKQIAALEADAGDCEPDDQLLQLSTADEESRERWAARPCAFAACG